MFFDVYISKDKQNSTKTKTPTKQYNMKDFFYCLSLIITVKMEVEIKNAINSVKTAFIFTLIGQN